MAVTFISQSGAVAGEPNAHELVGPTGRLLLDCGASAPGAQYVETLDKPSAVWISHAHFDHCGGLFDVLGRWPRTVVLATKKTAQMLMFSLDSGGATSGRGGGRVEALRRRITTVPWRRFRDIPRMKGVQIMALGAGHVPGAAMAVVDWGLDKGSRRILYTGDFCTHDQALVRGAGIPKREGGFCIDAVISEAMLASDREAEGVVWSKEADRLFDAVARRSGPAIVGTSPVGESLEVATIVARGGQQVMIDDYLKPLFDSCGDELGPARKLMSFGNRRKLRGHLEAGGAVVATGDQYRRSTTAGTLVEPLVGDPAATIIICNRARSSTDAGRLLDAEQGSSMRWRGRTLRRRAKVVHCRLPNHAPRWQLEGFIRGVGADQNFLVHATTGARWALKRSLGKKGFASEVTVVEGGERYVIAPETDSTSPWE